MQGIDTSSGYIGTIIFKNVMEAVLPGLSEWRWKRRQMMKIESDQHDTSPTYICLCLCVMILDTYMKGVEFVSQ